MIFFFRGFEVARRVQHLTEVQKDEAELDKLRLLIHDAYGRPTIARYTSKTGRQTKITYRPTERRTARAMTQRATTVRVDTSNLNTTKDRASQFLPYY